MALIIGGASSAITAMYSLDEAKASQMNSIDDFMKHNKVSAPVQQSIRDFYKALWLHGFLKYVFAFRNLKRQCGALYSQYYSI